MHEGVRFVPVSFAEIDGWQADDQAAAFQTLLKSCRKIAAKPDSPPAKVLNLSRSPVSPMAATIFSANGALSFGSIFAAKPDSPTAKDLNA